jgi:anti-sigma regulatory factor (Ser/Thr protein kinase)
MLCKECPSHATCEKCVELIEGGNLRKKVSPPMPITLYQPVQNKTYNGSLVVISRIGMLIKTNAPMDSYIVNIKDKITAEISPIYVKGLKDAIAFDINHVIRNEEKDERLSKEAYDFLFSDKNEVINKLTEHLDDTLREKLREEFQRELFKTDLIDRLKMSSCYRYEKGRLRLQSGEKHPLVDEYQLIDLIETAVKKGVPQRDYIMEPTKNMYLDIHAIPLSHDVGGILTFDVSDIVKKEKDMIREQWNNYRDVILSLTNGKLHLMERKELGEHTLIYEKKFNFYLDEIKQMSELRQGISQWFEEKGRKVEYKLLITTTEAVTNALKYSGQCEVEIWQNDKGILILVGDHGHGITLSNLPKATLIKGFSTSQSLGQGFHLMTHYSDMLYLVSDTSGTSVGLYFSQSKEGEE